MVITDLGVMAIGTGSPPYNKKTTDDLFGGLTVFQFLPMNRETSKLGVP